MKEIGEDVHRARERRKGVAKVGISAGFGSLIGGAVSGIGSIFAGNSKANAATQAAQIQAQAAQQGINTIGGIQQQQTANQQPFMQSGQMSLQQLMAGLSNGTFGQALQTPGAFQAPTLADAQNSPGYQFTATQGTNAILKGAAAAGGNISGGTLKSLDSYNTGLADNTYQNVFNRALQGYQAQLQGYGAQLAGNQQAYNQLFAPSQLGASSAANLNSSLGQDAGAIADLYTQQGNARAAGVIGANNATTGGYQTGLAQFLGPQSTNLSQLSNLFGGGGGVSNGSGISWTPPPINYSSLFPGGGTAAPPTVGPAPQGPG